MMQAESVALKIPWGRSRGQMVWLVVIGWFGGMFGGAGLWGSGWRLHLDALLVAELREGLLDAQGR